MIMSPSITLIHATVEITRTRPIHDGQASTPPLPLSQAQAGGRKALTRGCGYPSPYIWNTELISHLSGSCMALLGESNVADTFVIRVHLEVTAVGYVVKVLDILRNNKRVCQTRGFITLRCHGLLSVEQEHYLENYTVERQASPTHQQVIIPSCLPVNFRSCDASDDRTAKRLERARSAVLTKLARLLVHEVPQDIDVAVGARVRCENVVVRDDHHAFWIPNLQMAVHVTPGLYRAKQFVGQSTACLQVNIWNTQFHRT